MKHSFSTFISRRLTLKSEKRRGVSPAVVVAVGGIAVSVAVMLLTLCVVDGFKREIRSKIMGFESEITIIPYSEDESSPVIELSQPMRAAILKAAPEARIGIEAIQTGLIKTDTDFAGVAFRSFTGDYDWSFEDKIVTAGFMPSEGALREHPDVKMPVAVSEALASRLGLQLGDRITVYFFPDAGIKVRKFTVAGLYRSDFSDYDQAVAFAPYEVLAGLQGLAPGEGNKIVISGLPERDIEPAARRLQNAIIESPEAAKVPVWVTTVYMTAAGFFNWLALLDLNVVVIIVLMGCVSSLMLISCVITLILERVRMIGILKALGADNRVVRMVFAKLGMRVTLWGMLIGNLLGLAIFAVQALWHPLQLDPASYYLSYVPMSLQLWQWGVLNVAVLLLSGALMLIPTSMVARLSPVKTLRWE